MRSSTGCPSSYRNPHLKAQRLRAAQVARSGARGRNGLGPCRRLAFLMAAIETLLFDFGGTLDADGVAWKDRFYSLCRAEGLDMTADKFARAYYAADDPLVGALPI